MASKLFKSLKDTADGTVRTYFLNYQQFFKVGKVERWEKYE